MTIGTIHSWLPLNSTIIFLREEDCFISPCDWAEVPLHLSILWDFNCFLDYSPDSVPCEAKLHLVWLHLHPPDLDNRKTTS